MSNPRDGVKVDLIHKGSFARRRLTAVVGGQFLGEVVEVEPATLGESPGYATIRVLLGNCRFVEADEA